MNPSIWRNLLWKEWREQRWKLVALLAVVLGLHVWALDADEPRAGHYASPLLVTQVVVVPIAAVLLAVGLAASERSHRTEAFLRSQPIDLRKAAATKLAVAAAILVAMQVAAVLMTAGLLALVEAAGWARVTTSVEELDKLRQLIELGHWAPSYVLLATLVGVSLVLWIAAPAVNSASEVRAGAIGLVVVVALWAAFMGVVRLVIEGAEPMGIWSAKLTAFLAAALPGGIWPGLGISGEGRSWSLSNFGLIIPALMTHVPLAWWYVTRFGEASDPTGLSPRDAPKAPAAKAEWLGPPMRSPIFALGWKQLRQGAPVALAGAACAVAVTIFTFVNSHQSGRGLTETERLLSSLSGAAVGAFMILGCCAGLVGGAGALTTELEPRLFTFWRSRPISPDLWFWTTFASGLALLLLVFGAPLLLAQQVAERLTYDGRFPEPLLPILAASYVAGAFAAAMLRHAVYASFLGIGVLCMILTLPLSDLFSIPEPLAGPAVLLACAVLTVVAWVAVRNDWSLRLN